MNSNKNFEDELDFKALAKSPLRLFGWVYVLFIGVILVIGIYFVKNLDKVNFNESPQTMNDSLGVYEDKPFQKGGLMPSMDINLISNPTPEMIAKGAEQYKTLCATCHGESGDGNGVAGAALNPKPRNFLSMDGWTNGVKFIDLYKTLQVGILKNGMAAYEYLPPEERVGMIHYIRTLATYPEITEQQVTDLDAAYNISAGVNQPHQVPVATAIKNITKDSEQLLKKTDVAKYLSENADKAGAKLLAKYSNAPEKVLSIVANNGLAKSLDVFVQTVSVQPGNLGLNSSAYQMTQAEYSTLYKFLKQISVEQKS